MNLTRCLLSLLFFLAPVLKAEVLSGDAAMKHPAAKLIDAYIHALVDNDWEAAARLTHPDTLNERFQSFKAAVKQAPTMSDESAMLGSIGLKDLADVDKLTAQQFFIAERKAVHDRLKIDPSVVKRKQETLKYDIMALVERDGVVYALIKAYQETGKESIDEVLYITARKDSSGEWKFDPMLQRPVLKPLGGAKEPTKDS